MERENGNNGNTVLLTVIGVATLLVALVGATFAYFSATITNDANQSVIISTATPVGLEYISNKSITIDSGIPGATGEGSFTVTNPATSTVAQTYDLDLIIDTNEFTTALHANNTAEDTEKLKDQLELTISATGGTNTPALKQSTFNLTDGTSTTTSYKLVDNQRIEIGETQTYTVNVNFKDLDVSQDSNQGKNFRAHIDISDPVSVR